MTKTPKRLWIAILLVCFGLLPQRTFAQEDMVTVPDLTGQPAPKAAAMLNRLGLNFGTETRSQWTSASGLPQNSISAQSVAAGQQAKRGTAIDVTILRAPNLILIYDDKTLTLANQTGETLDLTELTFNTLDGTKHISFPGSLWQANEIDNMQCAQIAAVQRQGPAQIDPCSVIQTWFWTTNSGNHFWLGLNGVTRFNIVQSGVERGTCSAAQAGAAAQRCELYVPGSAGEDAAEYVYFAYTTTQLAVINKSADKWMPLTGANIVNHAPAVAGSTFAFADPKVFPNPVTIGQTDRLAPGQCLLYTNRSAPVTATPEPCDVIARLDLDPSVVFWTLDFGLNSVTDDTPHVCPAATPDKLTICAMPR
jgi:hypothetical protein